MKYITLFALLAVLIIALPAHAQDDELPFEIPEGTPIELGKPVEGAISPETPVVAYTFEGKEGDYITAYVEDEDFKSSFLIVTEPDGDLLIADSSDPLRLGMASRLVALELPEDGTYTIAVTESGWFYLQEAEENTTFTLTVDVAQFETIGYGETIEGELEEGQIFDLYLFEVEQTEIPYLILEAAEYELTVGVTDDAEFNESNGNRMGNSVYVSPRYAFDDGLYYVAVSKQNYHDPGNYSLTLNTYEPLPIEAGETVPVKLKVETLNNYLTFEGEEDSTVTITATATEGVNPAIVLIDPDGRVLAFEETSGSVELELDEDGDYVIMVFPQGEGFMLTEENLGTVDVTLEIDN